MPVHTVAGRTPATEKGPSLLLPLLRRLAFFGLFPVVLGIGLTWLYAYIFTIAGVYDGASPETQARRALCMLGAAPADAARA